MILYFLYFLIASACTCLFGTVWASAATTEINLTGMYKWTIVTVIDNSKGEEYVTQQAIEIKSEVDKDLTVDELRRKLVNLGSEFVATVDVVKLLHAAGTNEREYSHHEEVLNKLFAGQSSAYHHKAHEVIQKEITVSAGEIVVLYQLHFRAPGIFLSFPITTTSLKEVEVQLKFTTEIPPKAKTETMSNVKAETISKPLLIANGSTFAIQSFHGTYISAGPEKTVRMVKSIQDTEKWTFVHLHDDVYGLWSVHGTYLRAHSSGGHTARVDLHPWGVMAWGKWTVVKTPGGELAFRSVYGTLLRAHPGDGIDAYVERQDWKDMAWEQFHLVPVAIDHSDL